MHHTDAQAHQGTAFAQGTGAQFKLISWGAVATVVDMAEICTCTYRVVSLVSCNLCSIDFSDATM